MRSAGAEFHCRQRHSHSHPDADSQSVDFNFHMCTGRQSVCGVPFYPITNDSHKDEILTSIGPLMNPLLITLQQEPLAGAAIEFCRRRHLRPQITPQNHISTISHHE